MNVTTEKDVTIVNKKSEKILSIKTIDKIVYIHYEEDEIIPFFAS